MLLVTLAAASLLFPQEPASGAVAFHQACLDATCDAVILNVAAHPDDEAARTLIVWRHAHGARTVTLYTTCGEGGQNAIGREIGPALAAIRVRETLAAAQHSGTRVRWLGFPDFGYSKTREETLERWGGGDALLAAMRAAVDDIAPDVVFTNHGLWTGHGHHRASGWAIRAVCDERALPLYERASAGRILGIAFDVGVAFDPALVDAARGTSFAQQAHDGLLEHATQGPWSKLDAAAVRPDHWLPIGAPAVRLGADPAASLPSVFDHATFVEAAVASGIDVRWLRAQLAVFAMDRSQNDHVEAARTLLPKLRVVRSALAADDPARARLDRRIDALERVILARFGFRLEARIGLPPAPTRGAEARLCVALLSTLPVPFTVTCGDGAPVASPRGMGVDCVFRVPDAVPPGDPAAALTESVRVPVRAEFDLDGLPLAIEAAVEIPLGPSLRASWPREAMFVPADADWERVVSLEVQASGATAGKVPVRLRAPAGVTVEAIPPELEVGALPSTTRVFVKLRAREGALQERFVVQARVGDADAAQIDVQPLAAAAARARRVALVRGPDDTTERFLEDLGIPFEALDERGLAVADLSRFAVLLLDIRAYHHRPDLATHKERIGEFVRAGGRVVVLYHKPNEWNARDGKPLLAPFELKIGDARVSEEDAAVEILAPGHALLEEPFSITGDDFTGWVHERGLNFAETWDPEWQPLLRMHDTGEKPLDGALLVARDGAGEYVFCALALYRQLRVGHPGAARIMLDLIGGA